jgi:hypothetical protein
MLSFYLLDIITKGSVPSSSGSSSPRKLLGPEDEGTTILQIVEKYLPTDRLLKTTQTNTVILIVTTMRTSKSKLICTMCSCTKCCALFCASSSVGVKWVNYIHLVLSFKVCGSVPPVLHILQSVWFCSSSPSHSSKCVVLFLQSFTFFKVCGSVPPVLHMFSKCVALFLQSFTRLQNVWCCLWFCSSSSSHVFKVHGSVPSVPHMSSKCVVLFLQFFTCLQSVLHCSSSPSHLFKVCGSVPPVLHMSSKWMVLN